MFFICRVIFSACFFPFLFLYFGKISISFLGCVINKCDILLLGYMHCLFIQACTAYNKYFFFFFAVG